MSRIKKKGITGKTRLYVDTNVLMYAFSYMYRKEKKEDKNLKRNYLALLKAWRDFDSATSTLCITQTIAKHEGKFRDEVRDFAEKCYAKMKFLSVYSTNIRDALNLKDTKEIKYDLEDNIQFSIATANGCNVVLTNNIKDFKYYPQILAIKPANFK